MRERHIHRARVYLAQARAFRAHPAFHAQLLKWAANCRRRAAGVPLLTAAKGQGELFEGGSDAVKERVFKSDHRQKHRRNGQKRIPAETSGCGLFEPGPHQREESR